MTVAETDPNKEKPTYDWEAIEREFRAGQLSVREISRQYGISHVAIHKRAKKKGWIRDLAAKVKRAVEEKLIRDPLTVEDERQIIDTAAERGALVIKLHRTDVAKSQQLVGMLAGQLKEAAETREELEDSILDDTISPNGKIDIKRRAAMLRAVSLPAHAGVLRDLSMAQKNLIALERQAFGLNGHNPEEDDQRITSIHIHGVKPVRVEVTT